MGAAGKSRIWTRGAPVVALAGAAVAAWAAEPPDAASVRLPLVVRADRSAGSVEPRRIQGLALECPAGQLTSTLADSALGWIRAAGGVAYVRLHNVLGDGYAAAPPEWRSGCGVAQTAADGALAYRWSALERVLDALVTAGIRPVIVCGGLPDAVLAPPIRRNDSGAAANVPADVSRYRAFMTTVFRRLVKSYGAAEVRTWLFEVWSQPDDDGSWQPSGREGRTADGRARELCRLYDSFVAAADAADPAIQVGGPGTVRDTGLLDRFLAHCARGTNTVTGRPGTRLNFVSWGRYGPAAELLDTAARLREKLAREYPELKSARLVLAESGAGAVEGRRSNDSYEAARQAELLLRLHAPNAAPDLLFRSGELADDHFDGFRPLVTRLADRTVPLPALRLQMLASKLGPRRVEAETAAGVGVLAAAHPESPGSVQVLVHHFDPSVLPGAGRGIPLRLRVEGLPAALLRITRRLYRIDPVTNSPFETWKRAGSSRPAPAELAAGLVGETPLAPSEEDPEQAVRGGTAAFDVDLAPNSVVLITLGAEPPASAGLCPRARRLLKAEQEMAAAAALQLRGDFERAVEVLKRLASSHPDTSWREVAVYAQVGIFDLDLRSPARAAQARREVLALTEDDDVRLRLLTRLRVDAIRDGNSAEAAALQTRIAAVEKRLAAQREWSLRRYPGLGREGATSPRPRVSN